MTAIMALNSEINTIFDKFVYGGADRRREKECRNNIYRRGKSFYDRSLISTYHERIHWRTTQSRTGRTIGIQEYRH